VLFKLSFTVLLILEIYRLKVY